MAAWLKRLMERLGQRGPSPSAQADRIDAVWADRQRHGSAADLFRALREAVGGVTGPLTIDDGALRALAGHLRGGFGSEAAARGGHLDEHIALWRDLAERSGHPHARAFLADTLLAGGHRREAMIELDRALAADPSIVRELGDLEHDPEVGDLDGRLVVLRAELADLSVAGDDVDDHIRELYGALCDDYADDPAALARVHEIGRLIDAAVARGDLPRALVRRRPR